LESIVSKIDFSNTGKSVDGIFKMIDYGHQSIADMTPIALFIDGISQVLRIYLLDFISNCRWTRMLYKI
jgi:hypothetical protein